MSMLKSIAIAFTVVVFVSSVAIGAPEDTTADAVLGQTNFTGKNINQGGANASASSMQEPRGLAIDPTTGRLWVCDTLNNRVLSWPDADAFTNGQDADIVLGQVDFTHNLANKGNAAPDKSTLNQPRNCVFDAAGHLYVSDFQNFRLLRYDPPIGTNEEAVQVFGQNGDFTTAVQNNGGTSNTSLGNPNGLAVDSAGNLYHADVNLHRVLIFNTPVTDDTTADVVLGQATFLTNTANQPVGNPAPNNLNMPIGVALDADDNLYVADSGNNRVLMFEPPLSNGKPASKVFGQVDFTHNNANDPAISATTMSGPVSVTVDLKDGRLYVADATNSRTLEFVDPGSDATADRVFGQNGNFAAGNPNQGGGTASADTQSDTAGVIVDSAGNMYVSDRLNHRVLRYNASAASATDTDGDGVPDSTDNCPNNDNPDQADEDNDGVGDACPPGTPPDGGCANCGPTSTLTMTLMVIGCATLRPVMRRRRQRRNS